MVLGTRLMPALCHTARHPVSEMSRRDVGASFEVSRLHAFRTASPLSRARHCCRDSGSCKAVFKLQNIGFVLRFGPGLEVCRTSSLYTATPYLEVRMPNKDQTNISNVIM